MKAILFENEIVTLENFFSAEINSYNRGSERNPYYEYNIEIGYTNTDYHNYLRFGNDAASAKEWLNKIFEAITKEEG